MKSIPPWLIETLKRTNFKCPFCEYTFEKNNIVAIGVRESSRKAHKEVLFIEYDCNRCEKRAEVEFEELKVEEVIGDLLGNNNKEDYEDSLEGVEEVGEIESRKELFEKKMNDKINKRSGKKSKITIKEVKDFVKKMYSIENNEEFLLEIGLTQEEIDKYTKNEKYK